MITNKRAVELVAVGLGQAGGNLAGEFFRRGYGALAFNTATTDLTSLAQSLATLTEDQRYYIGLKGYDGAGSDIAYGRECIRAHADSIRQHVRKHAANADALLLTAGLGGGTGSAVSELIHTLEDLSIPILVLATLPTEHESGIAKVNAMRALNDLLKHDRIGTILVNNSHLAVRHGDLSYDRYYTAVNSVIAEPLDTFNRLNSQSDIGVIRSLDGEDYRNLLLSKGLLCFATATLPNLQSETVMNALRDKLLVSDIHPAGYRLEDVSYLAAVIEAPEHMLCETPFAFFERLSEQLKEETGGAGIFMGVYRTAAPHTKATLRVVASSQMLPDGVTQMVGEAKREGGELQAKLRRAPNPLALGEIEEFELFGGPASVRRRIAPPQPAATTLPATAVVSPGSVEQL